MQEILPFGAPVPPISPAVLGELSRRVPSAIAGAELLAARAGRGRPGRLWAKMRRCAPRGCEPGVLAALGDAAVPVIAPGGSDRTSRPTPPTPLTRLTSFAIGWMRNISVTTPAGVIFHTRPTPV